MLSSKKKKTKTKQKHIHSALESLDETELSLISVQPLFSVF